MDKENKIIIIDGKGTLVITKNEYGLYCTKAFLEHDDFKTHFYNVRIIGMVKGLKGKIINTIIAVKYIWF